MPCGVMRGSTSRHSSMSSQRIGNLEPCQAIALRKISSSSGINARERLGSS